MKATLEFDLPDERVEHRHAVNATDMAALLWDMDSELRMFLKHGNKEKTAEQLATELRQMMSDTLERIAE